MGLSKQVVSVEIAKKLREVGYPQEGLWGYSKLKHRDYTILNSNSFTSKVEIKIEEKEKDSGYYIVAPTVAELGEALPLNRINCYKAGDKIDTYYFSLNNFEGSTPYIGEASTEADARALMWLKLKEEGLL